MFENVEAADQCSVPPQLLLVPLGSCIFEVLHYRALKHEASLDNLVHAVKAERDPLPLVVLVAGDQSAVAASLENREDIIQHLAEHGEEFVSVLASGEVGFLIGEANDVGVGGMQDE